MFKIVTFKCQRCELEQEQLISNSDNLPEDSCQECQALPDNLQPILSVGKHGQHISWAKWRMNHE